MGHLMKTWWASLKEDIKYSGLSSQDAMVWNNWDQAATGCFTWKLDIKAVYVFVLCRG